MPAPGHPPEPPTPRASDDPAGTLRRRRELDAVPAFLRQAERTAEPGEPSGTTQARPTIPRPATPPPRPEDGPPARLDPASLPMPSLSRRRVVTAAGILAAALMTLSFVRQVGEATAATNRAADLRGGNAALRAEVERLEQDLGHVQDPRFIQLEARAYGLGGPREIPFALAADAPALPPGAPGSAAARLGASPSEAGPLEAWLDVLFGPGG